MTFKIRLIPDKWHLQDVGKLDSGALYWIDVQLNSEGGDTRDFVATYVFDLDGTLIWNDIEDLGLRSNSNLQGVSPIISRHREKLGPGQITDISVHPFSVNAHGLVFGLVIRKPEPDDENWQDDEGPYVDAMPGWTLMFYPPWEEGLYDT